MYYLVPKKSIDAIEEKRDDMIEYLNDFLNETDSNINDFIIIKGDELLPFLRVEKIITEEEYKEE